MELRKRRTKLGLGAVAKGMYELQRCWPNCPVLLSASPISALFLFLNLRGSSECQKHDWKNGTPTPHKQICGKIVTSEMLSCPSATKEMSNRRIPTPAESFQRSVELLYQIARLEEPPYPDYVVSHLSSDGLVQILIVRMLRYCHRRPKTMLA